MTGDPHGPGEAMQRAAGVLAAHHRGDLAGAEALLDSFGSDAARAQAFCWLADLALGLVRSASGQSMAELVQELNLLVGTTLDGPL